MDREMKRPVELAIGHVLFIDIVAYSKRTTKEQNEAVATLNWLVQACEPFRAAESADRLLKIATGDGMALVFYGSPEEPVECAVALTRSLKNYPELQVRMGVHSGPVSGVVDVTGRANVAGAGINLAQRVMDCADPGHILLSKHAAEDLAEYEQWRPMLHNLGSCQVKHGLTIDVVNMWSDGIGNSQIPSKLRAEKQRRRRRLWAFTGGATALLIAVVSLLYWRTGQKSGLPVQPSVAVLPLENLSDEKENAYFADGIQDELLSNLAKIKDLKVISRTSVMQYKTGINRNLKEIAHQLGVTNVVEGSVRRSENHLRVSVQLIDALTDRHIWAQNYDRTVADSVALQGELATQIASEVGATLSPQEKARLSATPTKNTAAYDAYLRGRALEGQWELDNSNFAKAAEAYQKAVTLDPGFALAWVYLSARHSGLYWEGDDHTPARLQAAKEAADRAIALDPNLPEIHLALGFYRYYGQRDFKGALEEFQVAQNALPNDVGILRAMGLIHRRLGHWDEVIAVMRRAFELDPRNVQLAAMLANAYLTKRNNSDAMAVVDHILAIEPTNQPAIFLKLDCFWGLGNLKAADQFLAKIDAPVHARAHQAFAARRWAEAADLFSKVWNDKLPENEKKWILLDIGKVQQRLGNIAASKAAYQEALHEFTQALTKVGADADQELHTGLGAAYAGLADAPHAISEGQKAMALCPTSEDPFDGPLQEEAMAQIYAALGSADEAIPILKHWVHVPSATSITPTLLRIDPAWDPIRNDPRFQELCLEPNK